MRRSGADRGQAFTFESLAAGVVLALALITAMQIVGSPAATGTPTTGEQGELGEGVLTTSVVDGSLKHTLLAWNTTRKTFEGGGDDGYTAAEQIPTELTDILDEAFHDTGYTANIQLIVTDAEGATDTLNLLRQGTPPTSAVTNRHALTLYDSDQISAGPDAGTPLQDTNEFYVADTDPNSAVYAVVYVEITVWSTR